MKIMAVDYGDARTGVAFSDLTGSITGETLVLYERRADALADELARLALDRRAERVVLGLPKNMNGTEGPRAGKSRALAELLTARGLDVAPWDERRTTVAAHNILNAANVRGKKRRGTVDAVAASLILEGYLDFCR